MNGDRIDIEVRRLRSKILKRLVRYFLIRLGSRVRAFVRPQGRKQRRNAGRFENTRRLRINTDTKRLATRHKC